MRRTKQRGEPEHDLFKDAVKSVLRIGSAHNKGGPADINIAQISHLSNFSVIKLIIWFKLWFIFIYEHSKPEKVDNSVVVNYILQIRQFKM